MRVLGFNRSRLAWVLALLALLPPGVEGQLRTVVSNEIAKSEREATLRLDFQDDGEFSIAFRDSQVLLDGVVVGSFARRDELDSAWRTLLGEAITLDDGPLAQALVDWAPPEGLTGDAGEVAARLDRALEKALTLPESSGNAEPAGGVSISIPEDGSLLGALLSRSGVLTDLAEALAGISLDQASVHIGEDLAIEPGEEMEGSLILLDGDLELAGTVRGDVVVVGGTATLLEEGRITGDLRVAEGTLVHLGGSVDGAVLDLGSEEEILLNQAELEDLRRDMEDEIRRDLRSKMRTERRHSTSFLGGLFGNVGRAISGLLENLLAFLVLAVLGGLAVHFQKSRLEIVATTARRAPARSAMVGLAGAFLFFPVWLLGIVALAVSVIGIPFLLAWIPLFPIAAGLAGLLGYLAVARNVGEWVAEQEYRGLEWIRGSNTLYTVVAGVGALMVPCVASSAARILGFGMFTGFLAFIGSMVAFIAVSVGLGAVLLTRGGKIRPFDSYYEFDEEYWTDEDPRDPAEAEWNGAPSEADASEPEETPAEEDPKTEEPRDEAPGEGGPVEDTPGSEESEDDHE